MYFDLAVQEMMHKFRQSYFWSGTSEAQQRHILV